MMKAIVLDAFGPADHFRQAELPVPSPGHGQLRLAVEATSVNPIDTKIRSGSLPAISPALPAVLHGDVVGTIDAVGPGVGDWVPRERVWACAGGVRDRPGALAEYVCVDARACARAPASLPPAEAAALPLVGITAWLAVVERANVRPGQRVLVHGGSGGVGHVAVQLARVAGAHVTTTVSTEAKAQAVQSLGADTVLIGRESVPGLYDAVIDTLGGPNLERSLAQIQPSGSVVSIAGRTTADLTPLHGKNGSLHIVFMLLPLLSGQGLEAHAGILTRLASLVDAGQVRPLIAKQFAINEIAEAHQCLEAGSQIGKIVLSGWARAASDKGN